MGTPQALPSSSSSSELFSSYDSEFIRELNNTVFPGELPQPLHEHPVDTTTSSPPSCKRRRSQEVDSDPSHHVLPPLPSADQEEDIDSTIYGASRFGQFGEYMRRKRAKLQIQNTQFEEEDGAIGQGQSSSQIFRGLAIYVRQTLCAQCLCDLR
jgi:DNA repair protein REV1